MYFLQELEALRSQVQSQSAEINQMKTERQELLRKAEAGVNTMQRAKCITLFLTDAELISFSLISPQSSDAVSGSDGSLDAAKMAELESRLTAQTTETERLKVCRISCSTRCVYDVFDL